jgi:hypothetical protein
MPPEKLLHELDDFKELLLAVTRDKKIQSQLVEKDYWIMHCLYGLKSLDLKFELKGGTSLSKGYGIIERFSEDIDIRIEPPKDMDVKTGKNQTKAQHIASRGAFYDWLANEKIKIPGIVKVERDSDFDNERLMSAGIRLIYDSHFTALDGVKPWILLEVGFDDTTPNEPIDISSWAYDKAIESEVEVTDNRAIGTECYDPAFTFVEKLQTVSTKFRKQQEAGAGNFPKNFLRHYYDIYCLLDHQSVQEFINTEEYQKRKEQRFPKIDNHNIPDNEAFILSDPEVRELYKQEYNKTKDLYHGDMVPFEDILERIKLNIERL